jgi:tetratricopeptide (TPR) repeat protein
MNDTEYEFRALFLEANKLYEIRSYDEALSKITKALSLKNDSTLARSLKACILIELWDGKPKTKNMFYEAQDHLNACIAADPKNEAFYNGNLGNLFYKLAITDLSAKGCLNEDIVNCFQKAKQKYNESLKINEEQPDLLINKGNTLDNLGRHFEALDCYDKAIILDTKHHNAWGCRGICCQRLSNLVRNECDKNMLSSYGLLCIAVELEQNPSFEIDNSYKKYVNAFIQQNKAEVDTFKHKLEEILQRKQQKIEEQFNLSMSHNIKFEDFYFDFCKKHDLFLNIHFDCDTCEKNTLDLFNISFLTQINDMEKPYELFKRWYSILDDYKTSRFYLSLSQYNHTDFSFLDEPRYESDYSLNYLPNVEILKTSFVLTMNIYDKVAFFLKEYEGLERADDRISFWNGNSIFYHTKIMCDNNWDIHLVALYTILRDLEKNELSDLVKMRNSLVHRYLILHDIINVESLTYPYGNNENIMINHVEIHEFYRCTIHSMRQLKTVLYALSFFVTKKEKNRMKESKGIIPNLEWTHNWDNNDELTKIANDFEKELKNHSSKLFESIIDILDEIDKE